MTMDFHPALPESVLQELRRHNLLQTLVQRRVVAEAVASEPVDPELANSALSQFCQQNGLRDEAGLQAFLAGRGLSVDDLRWQVELPLRIRSHSRERFGPKAEAHFLSRKNQLDRVVYSLLRLRDGFLARELYLRIAANEANFADLAAAYSEGPEKSTKGVVGPVPLTQAHPHLAERLRTSQPGQLLEPFMVAEWWLVARLESYTPATFDEGIAQQMAGELMDQWVQEETTRRITALCGQGEDAAPVSPPPDATASPVASQATAPDGASSSV